MLIVAWMAMLCLWDEIKYEVFSKSETVFPQSEHEAVEEFEHILVVAIQEQKTFMNFKVYQKIVLLHWGTALQEL